MTLFNKTKALFNKTKASFNRILYKRGEAIIASPIIYVLTLICAGLLLDVLLTVLDHETLIRSIHLLTSDVEDSTLELLGSLHAVDSRSIRDQLNLCQGETYTLEAETLRLQFCNSILCNRCLEVSFIVFVDGILEVCPVTPVVNVLVNRVEVIALVLVANADDITSLNISELFSLDDNGCRPRIKCSLSVPKNSVTSRLLRSSYLISNSCRICARIESNGYS